MIFYKSTYFLMPCSQLTGNPSQSSLKLFSPCKVMWPHAVPSFVEPSVICPWWSLQRWLLSVSHGPFRAGYYLLIFVPHVQRDDLLFAAGISSSPSQAATFLGHHSTPLGPVASLGPLLLPHCWGTSLLCPWYSESLLLP